MEYYGTKYNNTAKKMDQTSYTNIWDVTPSRDR